MKPTSGLLLCGLLAAITAAITAVSPATAQDASTPPLEKPAGTEGGGKKKKKKDKDKDKPADLPSGSAKSGAKDDPGVLAPAEPAENPGDWCDWLSTKPGLLHEDKKNPWIDKFLISGRFHYQAGHVSGEDVRGNSFDESFDEYRRFRLETEIGFLQVFDVEVGVNLVDDRRFRNPPDNDLDWGYDTFDSAILTFNFGKAFGRGPFDDIKLHYGRMKLRISEEVHTSSNRIHTVERSSLADKLGGNQTRPTGATLELAKGPWSGTFGVFSGEDDSDFIGGWNDGEVFYASLAWQATDDLLVRLDHVQNNESGTDDILGYSQATSLSATYEKKDWGLMVNLSAGDNGGAGNGNAAAIRQGNFHGAIVMPWYWIVRDRLQLVARYQYARADEAEGLRIDNRYIGALHSPPDIDLDGGYGDENHSFYLGLNWHLCGDNLKVMGGVSYDTMSARTGDFDGTTWLLAVRTFF